MMMVIKRFLRLFREHRELEKDLEREAALNDSLRRFIEALEGRDKERLARIEELEARNRDAEAALLEAHKAAVDLRTRLITLRLDKKGEP
jgi:hypothetical protein